MLDRLKALKEQMGCTFWLALALIAIVLILIAVGIGRLVWTLVGRVAPEVVPAGPTPVSVVESRPMEVPAGVTLVGIDPAWQRIGLEGTTDVTIRIENVTGLFGADVLVMSSAPSRYRWRIQSGRLRAASCRERDGWRPGGQPRRPGLHGRTGPIRQRYLPGTLPGGAV